MAWNELSIFGHTDTVGLDGWIQNMCMSMVGICTHVAPIGVYTRTCIAILCIQRSGNAHMVSSIGCLLSWSFRQKLWWQVDWTWHGKYGVTTIRDVACVQQITMSFNLDNQRVQHYITRYISWAVFQSITFLASNGREALVDQKKGGCLAQLHWSQCSIDAVYHRCSIPILVLVHFSCRLCCIVMLSINHPSWDPRARLRDSRNPNCSRTIL